VIVAVPSPRKLSIQLIILKAIPKGFWSYLTYFVRMRFQTAIPAEADRQGPGKDLALALRIRVGCSTKTLFLIKKMGRDQYSISFLK